MTPPPFFINGVSLRQFRKASKQFSKETLAKMTKFRHLSRHEQDKLFFELRGNTSIVIYYLMQERHNAYMLEMSRKALQTETKKDKDKK